MSNEVEAFAEALCPPHHREGFVSMIVGQPTKFGPRKPCLLHTSQAQQILASPAMAERDARVRAEALREASVAMGGIGSHRDPCRLPDTPCLCGLCDDRAAAAQWLRDRADQQGRA